MNLKKIFHKDIDQYPTPDRESILGSVGIKSNSGSPRHKKLLSLPLAVAMALMLTFCVAAGGIIIANLNFDVITENNIQLTEVPEGYIGIYTVDDLVKLREDVEKGVNGSHYILMSDIVFVDEDYVLGGICEGGWTPIGISKNTVAVFNGNGHVIRNLQCHSAYNEKVGRYKENIGLFSTTDLETKIINLGMEDCLFTVEIADTNFLGDFNESVSVGAIAGRAAYIGGCYVDGITVKIRVTLSKPTDVTRPVLDGEYLSINVGGIAGEANYTDACYAENLSIKVVSDGEDKLVNLYAGGIAGSATSALTCWSDNSVDITAEGDGFALRLTDPIATLADERMLPAIMSEESFSKMIEAVEKKYGVNEYEYNIVCAHYLQYSEEFLNSKYNTDYAKYLQRREYINELYRYITQSDTSPDQLYVLDPTASVSKLDRPGSIVIEAFGDREAYLTFCRENNIRLGQIHCYVYSADNSVTESDAAGFDFERLWEIEDGKPKLRIFN